MYNLWLCNLNCGNAYVTVQYFNSILEVRGTNNLYCLYGCPLGSSSCCPQSCVLSLARSRTGWPRIKHCINLSWFLTRVGSICICDIQIFRHNALLTNSYNRWLTRTCDLQIFRKSYCKGIFQVQNELENPKYMRLMAPIDDFRKMLMLIIQSKPTFKVMLHLIRNSLSAIAVCDHIQPPETTSLMRHNYSLIIWICMCILFNQFTEFSFTYFYAALFPVSFIGVW